MHTQAALVPPKPKLWFIDTTCPKPYSASTLRSEAMGGTEATVVRVAEALAPYADITVSQHNWVGEHYREAEGHPTYGPLRGGLYTHRWKHIITLRDPSQLPFVRAKQPSTPLYAWLHDMPSQGLLWNARPMERAKVTCIAVSDWHRTQVIESLRTQIETPKVVRIYNPIDNELRPDDSIVDPYKLIFFSSPHKGLDYAIKVFRQLHHLNDRYQLYIANPGYLKTDIPEHPGITQLGHLSHDAVLRHVRTSLCCFHLNHVFPETFGLVTAEANAVGTPVLTHPIGASPEIVSSPDQLVDTQSYQRVIERVLRWTQEGKRVTDRDAYRMPAVVKAWRELLGL